MPTICTIMIKRRPGQKLATNLSKIAIMLFLRDGKKKTREIMDHLKEQHGLSESRGIRKHLGELKKDDCIEDISQSGKSSYWQWKNNAESFKRIVNFLTENSAVIRVIEDGAIDSGKTDKREFLADIPYMQDIQRPSDVFDSAKYWFDTEYAKSFFTKETIDHFVNILRNKCSKEKDYLQFIKTSLLFQEKPDDFLENILFGTNHDRKVLVTMMHHSPTFVLYVLNLDQLNPKRIISGYDIRDDIITSMILKDMIINRTTNQHGVGSTTKISSSSRWTKKKEFDGINIDLHSELNSPESPILVEYKKRKEKKK